MAATWRSAGGLHEITLAAGVPSSLTDADRTPNLRVGRGYNPRPGSY